MPAAGERAAPEHLVVGQITKPHGTRGELFVWPLTDRPEVVFATGRSLLLGDAEGELSDGMIVTIESARPFKRGMLVGLEGVTGRAAAEALAQRYLLLAREDVPPLEDDEVFYHELLGLEVVDVTGARVGRVREVFETEPHHLLEVEDDNGKAHLVPFAARIVREVDRDARRLVIDPPPGLLEL